MHSFNPPAGSMWWRYDVETDGMCHLEKQTELLLSHAPVVLCPTYTHNQTLWGGEAKPLEMWKEQEAFSTLGL